MLNNYSYVIIRVIIFYYNTMSQTGQSQQQGTWELNEKEKAKQFDIFNEQEAANESAEARETVSKVFLWSQTYENLHNNIPDVIEVWDAEAPLTTNVELLGQIALNVENLSVSSHAYETALATYGKDAGIQESQTPNEKEKDFIIQKLAIAISCNDPSFIHLDPFDREKLVNILLPLVSDSEIHLSNVNESDETQNENLELSEYPWYPYILRMVDNGTITPEEFQDFLTAFEDAGNIENIDFSSLHPAIKAVFEMISLSDETQQKMNKSNFIWAFPDYAEDMELKPSLQLIWENFISIPVNKDWHVDNKRDFQTAVEVAANKILWKVKNIDRSTEKFKRAMIDIKSEKQAEQIHGISVLLELKWIYEWAPAEKALQDEDALTKLLKKNHEKWQKGIQISKRRVEEIGLLEKQDAANDPFHSSATVENINTGNTSLQAWNKELETTQANPDEKKPA